MPVFEDIPEERDFRMAVRKFVARELTPHREEWDKNRIVPREIWRKMGKQGLLCPCLPEEYGGSGVNFKYSAIIDEELIKGDAMCIGQGNHSNTAVPYIYTYGSEALKEKLLRKTTTGEFIACFCLTEPNAGSDAAAITTKAVRDGDYYILTGQKTFITNGTNADIMVVMCKVESPDNPSEKKYSLIVVEGDSLQYVRRRQLEKMGRHGLDTSEIYFDDCKVPVGNLLGEEGMGFKYTMQKMNHERLEVTMHCQFYAEECLKEAVNYAKVREAFGRPIGNFEHISFELAEMATEVQVGRVFFDSCVEELIRGEDITMKVSMAKAWIAEMANRVAYKALQIHGGYGYMEEYRICRLYQDVRVLPIFAGTTEIMNLIIARQLGFKPVF